MATTRGRIVFIAVSGLLLAFFALVSLGIGHYPLTLRMIVGDWAGSSPLADEARFILYQLRAPRILMALIVGGALAAGGTTMQAMFRNPLVSPFVLGVSNGAALGAAIGIMYYEGSSAAIESFAFIGATVAASLAFLASGFGASTVTLLLFGIIVSSFCHSGIGMMQYLADTDHRLPALTFWMLGGFDSITASSLWPTVPLALACFALLLIRANHLNLLAAGDREAMLLGLDVRRELTIALVLSTLLVSTCVAKTGVIGWIGLVVPHLARMLVGCDNRLVLPFSIILGGVFMLAADDLARTLVPGEMPIGIITALIGSPIFAAMLLLGRKTAWR